MRYYFVPVIVLLAVFGFFAVREAKDRNDSLPNPAPVGVTVAPTESLGTAKLNDSGFDFAAVKWSSTKRAGALKAVRSLKQGTGLRYAFFLNYTDANRASYDLLRRDFTRDRWQEYRGKPLLYVFSGGAIQGDPRFSIVHINDDAHGNQYWVSNPPNIKFGHITLTASYVGRGISIDPLRTGKALDQQFQFAETNKDRVTLLLWHSWNVPGDRSALLPALVSGTDTDRGYAYGRVQSFLARWKRP